MKVQEDYYVILSRDRKQLGKVVCFTNRNCGVEDCRGTVLMVKWMDGKVSYPCTSGINSITETMGVII